MRPGADSIVRPLRQLYERHVRRVMPASAMRAARGVWLPVARTIGYPVSSPALPRPPLRHERDRMQLSHVLLACDLNPAYLDYWPSARRAWLEIVGIEPLLVLIADHEDVPPELRSDPRVLTFPPLPGVHTALQAQCIRLLFPAVVETDAAVLIADVDLYPLRRSYFVDPIKSLDSRFFVSYRDAAFHKRQVVIPYNAAVPGTWSELFEVSTIDDVRARLAEWTSDLEYDGRRAWAGWYRDQEILHETLTRWPDAATRWWVFDDAYTKHRQLDRLELEHEDGLTPQRQNGIRRGIYSDYVCLFPYHEHREVNDLVLRLGLAAAGTAGR